MWPFKKHERKQLPDFGSTEWCPACGGHNFTRHFHYDDWVGELMWVACIDCGWDCSEKTKRQTDNEDGKA